MEEMLIRKALLDDSESCVIGSKIVRSVVEHGGFGVAELEQLATEWNRRAQCEHKTIEEGKCCECGTRLY